MTDRKAGKKMNKNIDRHIVVNDDEIEFVNFDDIFSGEGTVSFNIYPTSVSIVKGDYAAGRHFGLVTQYKNNKVTDKTVIEKLKEKGIDILYFNKIEDCFLQA